MTNRAEASTRCRRNKVYLEFDGKHGTERRKQRISCISARAVCDGTRDAGMEEAMLLRQLGTEIDSSSTKPDSARVMQILSMLMNGGRRAKLSSILISTPDQKAQMRTSVSLPRAKARGPSLVFCDPGSSI